MAKETGTKSGKTPSGKAPAALPAVRVASSLFRPQAPKSPLAPKAPMAPKVPAASMAQTAPVAPRVSFPSIPPPLPAAQAAPRSFAPPLAPIASEPVESIPPPPPSSVPRSSRDPSNPLAVMSLASIRVQAAPPSAPPCAPHYAPPKPMYQAPLSTTARMHAPSTPAAFTTTPSDAPVVMPIGAPGVPWGSNAPTPASDPSSAPSSAPASVRYERAFRSWSYSSPPPNEIEGADAEASQGPLTYAVYTAQDVPPVSRGSRAFIPPQPPPPSMQARIGMIAVGAAIVLCTAAAIILGVADDGPKRPTAASFAPQPAIDPPPYANPSSVTTTTSFIPPSVTIVDDPNAPAPAPKPRKRKPVANGDGVITVSAPANNAPAAPPPNPYAVSKK